MKLVPESIYLKTCSPSFPEPRVPHSPPWAAFRACWRSAVAPAQESVSAEADGKWPGKLQFVIDKGNPWSFIEDLCLFKRICETHPWILEKTFSLSSWTFFSFCKSCPFHYTLSFFSMSHFLSFVVVFLFCFLKLRRGTSLAIQWLRLCAPTEVGMGSVPGWGTKIPHVMWHHQKKKKSGF